MVLSGNVSQLLRHELARKTYLRTNSELFSLLGCNVAILCKSVEFLVPFKYLPHR